MRVQYLGQIFSHRDGDMGTSLLNIDPIEVCEKTMAGDRYREVGIKDITNAMLDTKMAASNTEIIDLVQE